MTVFAIVRAIHYFACLLVAGVWGFEWAVLGRAAGRDAQALNACWSRVAGWILALAWPAAILTGAAWLLFVAASMSGLPLQQAIHSEVLSLVWSRTTFGVAWKWRLSFAVAGVALCIPAAVSPFPGRVRRFLSAVALMPAAAFLAGLAWAGHGLDPPRAHLFVDVLHLLAAAFWPGGLIPFFLLLLVLRQSELPDRAAAGAMVTRHFSALSLFTVGVLIATGVANAWFLLHSPRDLIFLPYGRVLFAKILLSLVAIALGACNLLFLKPRLRPLDAPAGQCNAVATTLLHNVAVEIAVILVILILVGFLGLLPAGIARVRDFAGNFPVTPYFPDDISRPTV